MIPEYVKHQAKLELARRSIWEYSKLRHPLFYKEDRQYLKTMCEEVQGFIEQEEKKIVIIKCSPKTRKRALQLKNTVEVALFRTRITKEN